MANIEHTQHGWWWWWLWPKPFVPNSTFYMIVFKFTMFTVFRGFFLLFLTCSFFLFSTFRFIVGLAFFTPPFVIKYGNWYNDRFDFVWSTFCPESIHLIPLNVIYHLYCMCISAIFFSRKELPIDSPKLPPHSHTHTHIYRCIIHIYIYISIHATGSCNSHRLNKIHKYTMNCTRWQITGTEPIADSFIDFRFEFI